MALLYTLNHPLTNEIRYIGVTSFSLKERLRCHLKDCKNEKSKSHKKKWINSLLKDGLNPNINLLEEVDDYKDALSREIYLIAEYRRLGYRLVNNTDGGQGNLGWKPSKELIESIASKRRGKKLKPHTEEAKRRISLANKGRKMTEEQRSKMRGRVVSEESKKIISLKNTGRVLSEDARKKMSECRKKEWDNGLRKATRKGMKNSESHKEKMRGCNNPFFGKTHSVEMRKLISEKVKEGIKRKKDEQRNNK